MSDRPKGIVPNYQCKDCSLCESATKPVWGRGPKNPLFMLVGQSPGYQEDKAGVPFFQHAPAGGLITEILKELDVDRSEIYITNAVRCFEGFKDKRTGKGGVVSPEHIKACKKYLLDEIKVVNPKYIVVAGNEASKALLGHANITKEHGILRTGTDGRFYFPILHPASALPSRFPDNRNKIKEALALLIGKIRAVDRDPMAGIKVNIVASKSELDAFESYMDEKEREDPEQLLVMDLETNGLDNGFKRRDAKIGGCGFCLDSDEGWYVPLDHENPVVWSISQRARVLDLFRRIARSRFRKANQNVKFDYNYWRSLIGNRLRFVAGDSMLGSHTLDTTVGVHSLDKLAWKVGMGGYDQGLEDWFISNKIKKRNYIAVPLDVLGKYGVGDVVCSYRFELWARRRIEKRGQGKLYHGHIVKGIVPYADIEARGILVDARYVKKLSKFYKGRADSRIAELDSLVPRKYLKKFKAEEGKTVYDSPAKMSAMVHEWFDIAQVLARIKKRDYVFDENRGWLYRPKTDIRQMKAAALDPLKSIEILKSGLVSVRKGVLDVIRACEDFHLSDRHVEFLDSYLAYKADRKRQTTNVQGILKYVCPDDRIRSSYNLSGADTGRRSSSDPNLQNIPRDRVVKRVFISPEGSLFLMFDYMNLEARIAAAMSSDPGLLEAFNSGKDVHTYTASKVFKESYEDMIKVRKTPYEEIEKNDKLKKRYITYSKYRELAKYVMWVLLFGGGPSKVSLVSSVSIGEATVAMESMHGEFSNLRKMFDRFEDFADEHGYAVTDYGRRRYLPGLKSTDNRVRSDAVRQALNTPIQGTAAGITYEATTKVHRALRKEKLKAGIVQEVHDSLCVEAKLSDAYRAAVITRSVMESISTPSSKGKIRFEVDAAVGKHLGSKTALDENLIEMLRRDPDAVYNLCMKDFVMDPEKYVL